MGLVEREVRTVRAEGGCDYDYDCRSGLKCFQRDGMAPVPGCMGAGKKRLDYCIYEGEHYIMGA